MGTSPYLSVTTDGGRQVVIYTLVAGGPYPIHGAYFAGGDEWFIAAWTKTGKFAEGRTSGLDITKAIREGKIQIQSQ